MKIYLATVRQELETEVEFTEEDIEDGDTPEQAAIELALALPFRNWDPVWEPEVEFKEED